MSEHAGTYAYGDSDLAAYRLSLVAEAFRGTTTSFLLDVAPVAPGLAVDLGCGPGSTTRLIAELLHPRRTVGLDRSERFLERARAGAPEDVAFLVHDATVVPFPEVPADLIYCRLLVSHLSARDEVVSGWTTQLAPGGLLLLDEIEDIATSEPVFARYFELARHRVAAGGGSLYVGPELAAMPAPIGTVREWNAVATFGPSDPLTAEICRTNLEVLAHDPIVVDRWGEDHLRVLAHDLAAIGATSGAVSCTWRVRQIAFRRED